ncbi:hypothetical protein [Candidatus Tisiphia endosymbiont of Ceraclea dissimilis]
MTSGCFFYYFYAMRIVNSREFGARNDGATPKVIGERQAMTFLLIN